MSGMGGSWDAGTLEADATATKVDWVPTPRQARRAFDFSFAVRALSWLLLYKFGPFLK